MRRTARKIVYLQAWEHLTKALWHLVEYNPALAGVLYLWASDIAHPNARLGHIARGLKRVARALAHSAGCVCSSSPGIPAGQFSTCDVLLVPIYQSSNYMGMCRTLADAIRDQNGKLEVGIIDPIASHWDALNEDSAHDHLVHYRFSTTSIPNIQFLREAAHLESTIKRQLCRNSFLSRWFRRNRPIVLWRLAVALRNVQYARDWLRKTGCRLVITPTEQLDPASYLIAAAKLEGIPCQQILHGLPSRLYWPFISDETWVWGRSSLEKFLMYGAPRERLPVIGNIEILHWLRALKSGHQRRAKKHEFGAETTTSGRRDCLFFSQWHGSELWGIDDFKEAFQWIARALKMQGREWHITVRLHPHDATSARRSIRKTLGFLGDRLHFTDSSTPLVEDSINVDFACTVSSGAILTPLVMGTPCALLWTKNMNHLCGKPFLEPSQVASNPEELATIMNHLRQKSPPQKSLDILFSNLNDADKVAAQHVIACLRPG